MSITIKFTPEVEEALARRAEATGKDVETVVQELVTERLAAESSRPKMTPDEFRARLQKMIDRRPGVSTFVDDSRESIYSGRGE